MRGAHTDDASAQKRQRIIIYQEFLQRINGHRTNFIRRSVARDETLSF